LTQARDGIVELARVDRVREVAEPLPVVAIDAVIEPEDGWTRDDAG